MILDLLKALFGIGAVLGLWLLVQRLFRRSAGLAPDADPLASHFRCHDCKCTGSCEKSPAAAPHPHP